MQIVILKKSDSQKVIRTAHNYARSIIMNTRVASMHYKCYYKFLRDLALLLSARRSLFPRVELYKSSYHEVLAARGW